MKLDWEEVKDTVTGIAGLVLMVALGGGAVGILLGVMLTCMYTVLALLGVR